MLSGNNSNNQHHKQSFLRFVEFLNSVGTPTSTASSAKPTGSVFHQLVRLSMTPRVFPYTLGAVMLTSGLTGFSLWNVIERRQAEMEKKLLSMAANNNNAATVGISHNEAMTIAMVENARKSSASENLQNAIEAQEKFMLGSHTENKPEFLNKIKKRADELTGTQHPPERRQKNWYRMGSD